MASDLLCPKHGRETSILFYRKSILRRRASPKATRSFPRSVLLVLHPRDSFIGRPDVSQKIIRIRLVVLCSMENYRLKRGTAYCAEI